MWPPGAAAQTDHRHRRRRRQPLLETYLVHPTASPVVQQALLALQHAAAGRAAAFGRALLAHLAPGSGPDVPAMLAHSIASHVAETLFQTAPADLYLECAAPGGGGGLRAG